MPRLHRTARARTEPDTPKNTPDSQSQAARHHKQPRPLCSCSTKDKCASCSCTFTSNLRSLPAAKHTVGESFPSFSWVWAKDLLHLFHHTSRFGPRFAKTGSDSASSTIPSAVGLTATSHLPRRAHVQVSAQRVCRKPKLRTMESQNNVGPRTLNRCGLSLPAL